MKLTKYEHACFTIEKDDQLLVVDPGGFTTDFMPPTNVVAIVITHEHGDHLDHTRLAAIIDQNPTAIIVAHPSVTTHIESFQTRSVLPGDHSTVGVFDLTFYGGDHAVIHPDIPVVANLGVLINERVYYPGDSFTRPNVPVDVLALPIGAPWLKLSEAVDFIREVKPCLAFPTHDAVLSDTGKDLADRILPQLLEKHDIVYQRITEPLII